MPNITNQEDPFEQVREDVEQQLINLSNLIASYERIGISSLGTTSKVSPELEQSYEEIQTTLDDISASIEDMDESVKVVQRDPEKFGIDTIELGYRKEFIQSSISKLEQDKIHFNNLNNKFKINNSKNDINNINTNDSNYSTNSPYDVDTQFLIDDEQNEDYGNNRDNLNSTQQEQYERQQQELMMRQQDDELDGVFGTVQNLKRQAHSMGEELEEHTNILDSLESQVDRTAGKVGRGLKRIKWVLEKNNDNASSLCIILLIIALVVLLVLIIVI